MKQNFELPVDPERIAAAANVEQHIGVLTLQQEAVQRERGDRLQEGEDDRGFTIDFLEHEQPPHPVPVAEAIPELTAKDFVELYMSGNTPTRLVEDAWTDAAGKGMPGFSLVLPIKKEAYDEAVAAGKVAPELFPDASTRVSATQSEAAGLEALVTDDDKRTMVEKCYNHDVWPRIVNQNYVNELEGLDPDSIAALPGLLEAYEFTDADSNIRLLNLSTTKMSKEQVRQAANVIRSFSDKSGGELFNQLRTILVLPEDNPYLNRPVEDEDGAFDLPYAGEAKGKTLFISDRHLQRPEDRKPRSDRVERYWAAKYDAQLLPGEPTEGSGKPHHNSSRFEWDTVLAHELEHISLPPNSLELPGSGPTLYSRFNRREHEAELGALEFKGGEEALAVAEDQRQAKAEMWQALRGSKDGGLTYQQPQGPRFVTGRELDISKGPLDYRLKYPDIPLATSIKYKVT